MRNIRLDEEAVARRVRAFRRLGFFGDAGRDDDEVARRVLQALRDEWGDEPSAARPADADRIVLLLDERRVLSRDCECDPFPGNRVYESWVRDLCAVSRGELRLSEVEETWVAEPNQTERPVVVKVRANGKELLLRPRQWGDYVMPSDLVEGLNRLVPPWRPRLRLADTGGQGAFVVALRRSERRALEARGWTFGGSRRREPVLPRVRAALARAWDAYVFPFRAWRQR